MHIACMKELRFPSDTCPDLPDNLDALAWSWVAIYLLLLSLMSTAKLFHLKNSKISMIYICSLFKGLSDLQGSTDGVSQMRAPLHLALLILPIYLLLPTHHLRGHIADTRCWVSVHAWEIWNLNFSWMLRRPFGRHSSPSHLECWIRLISSNSSLWIWIFSQYHLRFLSGSTLASFTIQHIYSAGFFPRCTLCFSSLSTSVFAVICMYREHRHISHHTS